MPVQSLREGRLDRRALSTTPARIGWRRFYMIGGTIALTALAAWRLLAGDARLLRHNRHDADPQPDQRDRG